MKRKIIFPLLLCFLLCGMANTLCFAAEILVNEVFEDYVTNENSGSLVAEGDEGVRALETSVTNKALYLPARITGSSISAHMTGVARQFVVSADLRMGEHPVKTQLEIGESAVSHKLLTSDDIGNMTTHNGKEVCSLSPNSFVSVAIAYDLDTNRYSVYVDGRFAAGALLYGTKIKAPENFIISTSLVENASGLYVDNLRVYNGTRPQKDFPAKAWNSESVEWEEPVMEEGTGTVYVNDTYESGFSSLNINKKTNDFSYLKDGTENQYLNLVKATDSDMHMDFTNAVNGRFLSIEMDLIVGPQAPTVEIQMRDTSKNYSYLLRVTTDGKLVFRPSGRTLAALSTSKWTHVKVVIDLAKKTADAYVNDDLIDSNAALNNANVFTGTLELFRIQLSSGGNMGSIGLDNLKLYSGKEFPEEAPETSTVRKNTFPSDSEAIAALKGKTAFQTSGGVMYFGDKKTKMSVLPEEKDNIVMVPVRDFASAFGLKVGWDEASGAVTVGDSITLTLGANEMQANGKSVALDQPAYEKNGTTFVPLISMLEGGLGKSCTTSKYGLVMVNDKPQELADSKAKAVNGYLLYDRPSQEKVLADFQAFSANDKHPRVMATKEDFNRIRSQRETSETMGSWVKTILARADATLTQGTAQYIILDNKRLLNQCRVALNNMMYLGFAYQMTGDQKYADRAWSEVQAVGSFPNWNPTHFLDVGEMTAAVGIAYDWIYDAWSQEQKDYIVKIIKDFGLAPAAMEYSSSSYGFSKLTHNWNAVCSGGVGIGALAIAEADPEYCAWIVSSGIRGLEYLLDEFAPDGGYVEGPSYWEYAMQYMTMFFSSLYASLGTDYNLTNANGLSKTANYILSMDSSVGSIGFHDGGPGHSNAAYLFWLGDHYNVPGVISARLLKSKQLNTSVTVYDPLFYKDPSITASNIALPLDSYYRGVEAVSMRSSWTSGQEAFLAFHAGQLNVNHYHVDSGQFVYYNLGEMWATDFGTDNVTYTDGYGIRNNIYRIRAEGHNVMVINPNTSPGMVLNSFSPVEKFVSKERGSYSIVDLSSAYAENANSARRGFMMADDRRSITVRDEVSLRAPSEVYWFMHTLANVELTENGAILTKNGKQMKLECATNAAEYELLVMDAEPLPTSPSYPGQANNSAYKKFAIKMKASGDLNVEVRLVPADDAYADRGLLGKPLSEWAIPDGELLIPPSANMLSIDGEPLAGFAPETTSYTIEVPVGRDKMPAVTIDAGAYTVEADQQPDKVVYKIYDAAEPDNFRYYTVNYKIVDPLDTMLGYDRYEATVTASEIPQPENADINVLDNDLTTRWSAQNTQWLLLDLGEVKQIDAICLAFYMGSERQYQYTVEVSEDGSAYQKVANGPSIASDGYVITRLDGIAARYVRYNANGGSNVNAWNSILEFGALVKK